MNAKTLKHFVLISLLGLVLLTSCSPASQGSASRTGGAEGVAMDPGLANDVYLAYTLPERVLAEAQRTAVDSLQAVFAASQATGSFPTTTGTLQIDEDGYGSYTPTPTDRLVVFDPHGRRTDLTILRIDSDFHRDAEGFLADPHAVSMLISGSGKRDLQVILNNQGYEAVLEILGEIKVDGMSYKGHLSRQVSLLAPAVSGDQSDTDHTYDQEILIQGVIGSDDLAVQVDEVVTVRPAVGETFILRTLNTGWTVGTGEYRFQDVKITSRIPDGETAFGKVVWAGAGRLLRNGLAAGEIAIEEGSNQVEVWVDSTGDTSPLVAWDIP